MDIIKAMTYDMEIQCPNINKQLKTWTDPFCQWLATGQWFSPGTPVSSTNKTDRHWNIVESGVKHHKPKTRFI